jgi:hypothetical protein
MASEQSTSRASLQLRSMGRAGRGMKMIPSVCFFMARGSARNDFAAQSMPRRDRLSAKLRETKPVCPGQFYRL